MNIEGVPESISRQKYGELIESLGLNPYQLSEMTFGTDGIYAVVKTTHNDPIEPNALAKHRIYIPIKD